ncbi:MAG: hypothetical protein Q8O10_11030 [candidate division Zixibacteria bacterium]|jgi:hypothetical protein|nr:hypothetical protein [candidate division Zixibacteria bacterium]
MTKTTNPNFNPTTKENYSYNYETLPYEKINTPGTYYFNPTGMLLRIPPEGVSQGHSPVIPFVWREECFVTKISDDPWVPISKARQLCANWDLPVNF